MEVERRKFITKMAAAGAYAFLLSPLKSVALNLGQTEIKIQDLIDAFIKTIPDAPFKDTVDTIKAGDSSQNINGIVTTMFPTINVIKKAIALKANFIIAHEPTFYNHTDDTSWLKNDDVYQQKIALLNDHKITIWRCHDYIHAHVPDGVLMGVLDVLDWAKYYNEANPNILEIQKTDFGSIVTHVKNRLHIQNVKVIGNLLQPCKRIAIIPGAAGGKKQITIVEKQKPDLLIVGEVNEWETSEYIRDLQSFGGKTALLVLGHIVSEEPGMQWMKQWINHQYPQIPVTHVSSYDAFSRA